MDDWRAALGSKLVIAEEAVARVRSGDLVRFPLGRVPRTLADAEGRVGFGYGPWHGKALLAAAKLSIAEVGHTVFSAQGDATVPLGDFDLVVESHEEPFTLPSAYPEPGPERREVTDAVGASVASLVNDRDTIQIGTGTLSALMGDYLAHKRDLGVDAEILVPSAIELVRGGAATGRYKTYH